MGARHSSNWKAVERKVAKKLGGTRIPLSGRNNMGKIGDVEIVGYHVEVKSGRQVPKAVTGWLDTLRQLATDDLAASALDDVLPVLVMQPFQKKEMIVVLTLSDFSRVLKGGTP